MSRADVKLGQHWLAEHGSDSCLYAQPNLDGLAAAALISRRAVGDVTFVDPFGNHLDRTRPMVIIDQGVKPVHSGSPVLYIDRHAAAAKVRGTVVRDDQVPAASLLAWRLIGIPASDRWLAALGVFSTSGESGLLRNRLEEPVPALRRLAALCAAPTVLRGASLKAAFSMLTDSDSTVGALSHPHAAQLERDRQTVEKLTVAAAGTRPTLCTGAGLLEIDVPAYVHPRLASAWARRLAPLPVVVANRGWRAPQVDYSIRGEDPDQLGDWLAQVNAERAATHARGGAYALDGSLSADAYARLRSLMSRQQPLHPGSS